jgi:pyruvate dehydrogenase E2 component (dihydrolipoamide acetyltransferase)
MAAMTEVRIPDLGDTSDVSVIEVLVAPGDTIAKEDPIVTLESDKASMDVPSPIAGVVEQVHIAVGDEVAVGTLVLTVAAGEADAAPEAPPTPGPEGAMPEPPTDVPEHAAAPVPSAEAEQRSRTIHASPLARGLARELGVALEDVTGSAADGRVTKDDVLAHAERTGGTAAAIPAAPAPAAVDFARFGPTESVPLSRIKKLVGANLHRNWVTIPHVTHHDEADITELEAFRVRTNEEHAAEGVKLTMVALLLRACTGALQRHPEFNASLDGDTLVLKHYYNLGVAVDTDKGLVVPVINDVARKGLLELARELADVSATARAGKLKVDQMQGGTFTISSLGGIGGTGFTPIVNAPEVAILGVTRAAIKPVWDGQAFAPRRMLSLSLSYDHRVIDGAAAARFTRTLAEQLEDLRRILL